MQCLAVNPRLLAAYEAAVAVAAEVTPDAVLQRLVDLAREVVPARYAALGVADQTGRIVTFLTSGLSPAERAAIGPLPEGRGLLGALIHDRTPLLVPDIGADPRAVGFPRYHPPMRTLLGVPVMLGERILGNLYLTERRDGLPFDEDDLAALQILATHAAATIDRAQAHREAEAQRDRFRVILDNLPTGVFILAAPEWQIEFVNTAMVELVFGPGALPGVLPTYGRDFALLRADGIPLPTEERPAVRALRGETVRRQQLLLRRASGREVPVDVHAVALRGAADSVTHAVAVVQDATHQREAEQLKDDFLALISHEFRTPLTAIHGGAHLLATGGDALDAQTRQEILADVVLESDRLDRLLGNLVNLSAVMAGRLIPATEPVLLTPLARAVAAEAGRRSAIHTFVVDVAPGLPPIEADPGLLEEVLRNLYENAIKYAPEGGEVRTTADHHDDTVAIRVIDRGIGIASEHVAGVFERFRRPGAPATTRGMGLGLYLSRHLVEAQGGRIEVSSPGPGQGSIFTITLPIARGWAEPNAT